MCRSIMSGRCNTDFVSIFVPNILNFLRRVFMDQLFNSSRVFLAQSGHKSLFRRSGDCCCCRRPGLFPGDGVVIHLSLSGFISEGRRTVRGGKPSVRAVVWVEFCDFLDHVIPGLLHLLDMIVSAHSTPHIRSLCADHSTVWAISGLRPGQTSSITSYPAGTAWVSVPHSLGIRAFMAFVNCWTLSCICTARCWLPRPWSSWMLRREQPSASI